MNIYTNLVKKTGGNMIGIVSYLPNEPKLRSLRKKAHLNQIKLLASVFPNEQINIIAQNYHDNEQIKYSKIKYFKYNQKLGPAGARNILLDMFYNSKDKVLFMLDDDITWYNYYDINTLLVDYYYNSDKYDIDFIVPMKPETEPFKKTIYKTDYEHYYYCKKVNTQVSLCCALIKNKTKAKQKEYDPNDKNSLFEDQLMLEEMISSGMKGYKIFNWVLRNEGKDNCTIIETTDKNKSNKWHGALASNIHTYIEKKYGITLKEYNKTYNKAEKELLIPRLRPYQIERNLIPKK